MDIEPTMMKRDDRKILFKFRNCRIKCKAKNQYKKSSFVGFMMVDAPSNEIYIGREND